MIRCINCNSELKLDSSLDLSNNNNSSNNALYNSARTPTVTGSQPSTSPVTDAVSGQLAGKMSPELSVNLFELIMNSAHPLDKPLCAECTTNLIDCLDHQLDTLENQVAEYSKVLSNLEKQDVSSSALSSTPTGSSKRELAQLQADEAALRQELEQLALEESHIDQQIQTEQQRTAELEHENGRLWQDYRNSTRKLLDLEEEEKSVRNQLIYVKGQLDKLCATNIYSLAFNIAQDGTYGKINNFRLGWMPNDNSLEWTEVNAAWGQAVLLLKALARRLELGFDQFEPVALGTHSHIKLVDKASSSSSTQLLPLYTTYGGRKFMGGQSAKMDAAMVAFMHCLNQLQAALEARAPGVRLPYPMVKDKIIDQTKEYSIRMQLNSEEKWTRACRFLLTNVKWASAWVASLDEAEFDRQQLMRLCEAELTAEGGAKVDGDSGGGSPLT